MGGESLRGPGSHVEYQIISMRADQIGSTIDLAIPQFGHGRLQAHGGRRDIVERRLGIRYCHVITRIGLRATLVKQQAGPVGEVRC